MTRIIDKLTHDQRYMILSEILEDMTSEEQDLVINHLKPLVDAQKDEDEIQRAIGLEIAKRKNNPDYASGTPGRRLI